MALDISRKLLGYVDGGTNYATHAFPVASGVTVTAGDFVYFSSGRITSATIATARIIGTVLETATGNAAGSVTALVAIDDAIKYLMANDNVGTTFAVTHVGSYFNLIGATGAQLVDTSTTSATLGQVLCLEYNPQIDPVKTDTTYGIFLLVNSAHEPYVANV
ncbi:hypothetical protein UFOVP1522_51 [uncultured Caudovirales phage]|uniref:Uncharacterized protein n=1 Tax=uncultured Caudovirales phage TaxID=2100421 RepID=A0A6J7XCP3_9CAUD|nr:hypothetical protein UFOVP989_36 [uncultured Caudovirales phage]CAB4181335.1 hypothetical protein UFOVP1075_30 [uncultured Caudovirales phage]CAB4198731.1 hypothetical protein UFOVP1312_22 [uncultured Caudovirales phage]CAB4210726.1 hypothetical protein UFOVP1426_36 [uncultured Caudovirales phage]CAB5227539.1 hypothetical protein UFOVP1522_51 [uncultured Caudovirales phage]